MLAPLGRGVDSLAPDLLSTYRRSVAVRMRTFAWLTIILVVTSGCASPDADVDTSEPAAADGGIETDDHAAGSTSDSPSSTSDDFDDAYDVAPEEFDDPVVPPDDPDIRPGGTEDQGFDGTPVLRHSTTWVEAGDIKDAVEARIEVVEVDQDRGAHTIVEADGERVVGWYLVGDVVLVGRHELEVLGARHDPEVLDVTARQLVRRPERPLALSVPGGSREFLGDEVSITADLAEGDGGVTLVLRDPGGQEHHGTIAATGDVIELDGYTVTVVERRERVVLLDVVDPEGNPLPHAGAPSDVTS